MIIAIVQARMSSMRMPGKVMKPILGIPLIECLLSRLQLSNEIDQIVVATTLENSDQVLFDHVHQLHYPVFRGSTEDVLDRYYQAALSLKNFPSIIVRITGDCPLIDPELVDQFILSYQASQARQEIDYLSNKQPATFPDGLDIEVLSFTALEKAWKQARTDYQREHVTPFVRDSGLFCCENIEHDEDLSGLRWTVDEPEDFEVIEQIFQHFAPNLAFTWHDVLQLKYSNPQWFAKNQHLVRDEGANMGQGQKLWRRAKRVIPGGNMLLSKRAEMFLPDRWPAYFSRAKGCKVWDLEGRDYIDFSIMGIGTNTLGYGHPKVDEAVSKVVLNGNLSTFNCPEEVWLAEKLVDMHPWAEQVRFARTGGEANAIAIRIARAASGRDKVALCGYHGWHDWYLAANLAGANQLDGHLLPGLAPNGVPKHLSDSVFTFQYNQLDELKALLKMHPDIGVIKMEVSRSEPPLPGFLKSVRELATQHKSVLIFDECTSGFRETFGGLHLKYGVEPDMAVFGKAIGNGYAITAVIGRRPVMEAAQTSFISSTFWTERIGPAAALATLEVMAALESWNLITDIGQQMRQRWQALADYHGVSIKLSGLPALSGFVFESQRNQAYKTYITQEMLKKGWLANQLFYACIDHTPELMDLYFDALDSLFETIRDCEEGRDIESLLEGPICHSGFTRLN